MGRYGTREAELDDLLRRGVFVDLLKVVRNGLRASRPGYGLKEMEAFLDFERQAEVKDGGASIVIFEQWMQTGEQALLDQIDAYNREDCIATRLLRDWLLELKPQAGPIAPAPPPEEPKPIPERKAERAELSAQLLGAGEELAAHLLDYHDRERKPVWWAFFDRIEMTPDELVEDAESIGQVEVVSGPEPVKKSQAYVLSYPAQEHKIGQGQDVLDPATTDSAGEILELDRDERRLTLKRGPSLADVPLPESLIPAGPYWTRDQEDALARFGRSLLARDHRYPALESVLRREPFDRPVQTVELEEMKELVRSLDGRHLVIQGPPGSGKTWTSGRLIADLIARGNRVGVASTSHKAIHNLLAAVEEAAAETGLGFKGLKKASAGNPESFYEGANVENVTASEDCVDCDLAAGTAWLFSNERHDGTLDYLFVDEAGQVSLADALAMGTAARNLVLVGDPLQLDQVLQGTHPGGSDASVLKHLLGDDATVPPDRGLFLERTFRLHPDICGYISEEFYEGRLEPADVARSGRRHSGRGCGTSRSSTKGAGRSRRRRSRRCGAWSTSCAPAGVTDVVVVRALQRAGERAQGGAAGRARRHRRQVPGAGGGRRRLLDGELERGGRPARPRVPALAQPAQRRDLAGALPRVPGLLTAAARGEREDDPADAARERALPVRRIGRRADTDLSTCDAELTSGAARTESSPNGRALRASQRRSDAARDPDLRSTRSRGRSGEPAARRSRRRRRGDPDAAWPDGETAWRRACRGAAPTRSPIATPKVGISQAGSRGWSPTAPANHRTSRSPSL